MLDWKEKSFTCSRCNEEFYGDEKIFDLYFHGKGIMCESCCRELTGIKEGVDITEIDCMIDEYTVDNYFKNQQGILDDEAYQAYWDETHIH